MEAMALHLRVGEYITDCMSVPGSSVCPASWNVVISHFKDGLNSSIKQRAHNANGAA
jgi:hypothetical protein